MIPHSLDAYVFPVSVIPHCGGGGDWERGGGGEANAVKRSDGRMGATKASVKPFGLAISPHFGRGTVTFLPNVGFLETEMPVENSGGRLGALLFLFLFSFSFVFGHSMLSWGLQISFRYQ